MTDLTCDKKNPNGKSENVGIEEFLHEFPSKIWLRNGIHSLWRRNDERASADIIYVIWCISQHCASHKQMASQIRSGIEYLTPSASSWLTLWRQNLISRLIRFIADSVVAAYFLDQPVYTIALVAYSYTGRSYTKSLNGIIINCSTQWWVTYEVSVRRMMFIVV